MPPLQPSITLRSAATCTLLCAALNERLADATDLIQAAKTAHWNCRGEPSFKTVHEQFDALAAALREAQDDIAERIRTLGGLARGTLQAAGASTTLPVYPLDVTAIPDHLREVVLRLAIFVGRLGRTRDLALERLEQQTANNLTNHLEILEKLGWFMLSSMPEAAAREAMATAAASLGGNALAASGAVG